MLLLMCLLWWWLVLFVVVFVVVFFLFLFLVVNVERFERRRFRCFVFCARFVWVCLWFVLLFVLWNMWCIYDFLILIFCVCIFVLFWVCFWCSSARSFGFVISRFFGRWGYVGGCLWLFWVLVLFLILIVLFWWCCCVCNIF